jgi:hypothetical protein
VKFSPAHFPLLLLYAFLVACVLGFRSRPSVSIQVRRTLRMFCIFVLTGVVLAWLMYPLSH